MRERVRSTTVRIAGAIAFLLPIVGCDGRGDPPRAAKAVVESATTASPQESPNRVDPCTLLTQEEVEAALGVTVSAADSWGAATERWSCFYEGASGKGRVQIVVASAPGSFEADKAAFPPKPVAGIGDEAYRSPDGLHVRKGDTHFVVDVTDHPHADRVMESLARAAVRRLR